MYTFVQLPVFFHYVCMYHRQYVYIFNSDKYFIYFKLFLLLRFKFTLMIGIAWAYKFSHFRHQHRKHEFISGFLVAMIFATVNLQRFLWVKHFLAYAAWNLLSFLMRNANVKSQIISGEVLLWTWGHGTFEVFNFCVSLKNQFI